jgi:Helix-turn-helix domain
MISEFDLHGAMVAAKVPVTPRHVLRVLRMREMMNPNGEAAWPSYQRIADDVGMSRRSIIEAVKWCAENGWLAVSRRDSDHGDSETNEYRIRIPVGGSAAIAPPSEGEGGSATIALGVVQQFHQGSEMAAPKEGREEGTLNEEEEKHYPHSPQKPANVERLDTDDEPCFDVGETSDAPGLVVGFARRHRIPDIGGYWDDFEANISRDPFDSSSEANLKHFFAWLHISSSVAAAA